MSSLIPKGSEASRLMQEFQSTADEAMQAQRTEQSATAQSAITAAAQTDGQYPMRAYRVARAAESRLIVNPDVPPEEMSASDYRKFREAEQRGETPQSYRDFIAAAPQNTPGPPPAPRDLEAESREYQEYVKEREESAGFYLRRK